MALLEIVGNQPYTTSGLAITRTLSPPVFYSLSVIYSTLWPVYSTLRMRQEPAFLEGDKICSAFTVQKMHALSLSELTSEDWKQELHPGHRLEALRKEFVLCVITTLHLARLSKYNIVQRFLNSTDHVV